MCFNETVRGDGLTCPECHRVRPWGQIRFEYDKDEGAINRIAICTVCETVIQSDIIGEGNGR